MPREKINEEWRLSACELKQNYPRMSAAAITRKLELEGAEFSERTVSRWLRDLKNAGPATQVQYQYVSWPGSFGGTDLPWEASRAVLDLMRYRVEKKFDEPMTVEAIWFWRVTIAAPALSIQRRNTMASALAGAQLIGPGPAYQWALAYGDSASSIKFYDKAMMSGNHPWPPTPDGVEGSWDSFFQMCRLQGIDPDDDIRFRRHGVFPNEGSKTDEQNKGEKQ